MLAATNCKCHINSVCHRLSMSVNSAWEAAVEQSEELEHQQ